jgi:hypothetical protein
MAAAMAVAGAAFLVGAAVTVVVIPGRGVHAVKPQVE